MPEPAIGLEFTDNTVAWLNRFWIVASNPRRIGSFDLRHVSLLNLLQHLPPLPLALTYADPLPLASGLPAPRKADTPSLHKPDNLTLVLQGKTFSLTNY
jgi:hypothetical protein